MEFNHIDDRLLAFGALKNDLLFHKIPSDKYLYYIDKSLKFGQEKAKRFHHENVRDICQKNNIQISFAKTNGKFYGVQLRAYIELGENKKVITLYEDSLEEIRKASQVFFQKEMSLNEVIDIHLAHELYHFYEYIDKEATNEKLDSIVRMKVGPIQLKSTIMSSCEIAAHAFAKELLNLQYLPNIYDYILQVDRKELSVEEFEEMILQWKGDLKC